MNYEDILLRLAIKENKSKEEIEKEMQKAIKYAGIDCPVSDFVFSVAAFIKDDI